MDPIRDHAYFGLRGCFRVWRDLGVGWGLVDQDWWRRVGVMIILPGIPLIWAADPVRSHVFFGFRGCCRVWRDLVQGGGLFDQNFW